MNTVQWEWIYTVNACVYQGMSYKSLPCTIYSDVSGHSTPYLEDIAGDTFIGSSFLGPSKVLRPRSVSIVSNPSLTWSKRS